MGAMVGLALAIFVVAGLVSIRKCDAQSACVSYGGGPVESNHFQGSFGPSSGTRLNGAFDKWFAYPTSVRAYSISDATGETGEEGVDAGETSLARDTRRYRVADVWANEDTLRDVERAVGSTLKDQVNTALGGQYFCGPEFRLGRGVCPDFQLKIKRPEIPAGVKAAFEQNRTSRILVTTKRNEVTQRAKEADAIRQVRGELSPEYVLLRAIEQGAIDFWVLPQKGNLTLPAPSPGG